MRGAALLLLACLAPNVVRAQDITVGRGAERNSGAFIREAAAQKHVVIGGAGRLELPRDSTITSTLIVVGRDTYLASKVQGNVVVVNGNLLLRPGVDVSGHAVAIGGTVASTSLGHVGGRIESYQDDVYDVTSGSTGYAFDWHPQVVAHTIPLLQPAGIYGILIPRYDRVNGLSLPLGALVTLGDGDIEVEPSVTYRSRLGAFDPGVTLRIMPERTVHFEGRAARDTRTNDAWIYSDLVNTATSFFAGIDARNYFRSDIGEGRLFFGVARPGLTMEPFIGARYEKVSGISAVGNVFSVIGRHDVEKMARPNPIVPDGSIGSALLGGVLYDTSGVVTGRLRAEVEQSFTTATGTSQFLQVTLDGKLGFPTFGTQRLEFHAHSVTTPAKGVAPARYAYLGGSGTMPNLDLLQLGGDELLYVESRYLIPIPMVVLPFVGSPFVTLRDAIGSAGVDSLPAFHHAIGVGVGLSAFRVDYTRDVTGRGEHAGKLSFGISLGK